MRATALRQSGADGVMIGRGAYGRPWLLGQVMSDLGGGGHRPEPSLDEQLEAMLEQYEHMLELYGTHTGVNLARKHVGWYTKGLPGSAELRNTRQPAGRSGGGQSHAPRLLFALAGAQRGLTTSVTTQVCCNCNGHARAAA